MRIMVTDELAWTSCKKYHIITSLKASHLRDAPNAVGKATSEIEIEN